MKYPPIYASCNSRTLPHLHQPNLIHCLCFWNIYFNCFCCCYNPPLPPLLFSLGKLPKLHHPYHLSTMSSLLCTQLSLPVLYLPLHSIPIVPLLLPLSTFITSIHLPSPSPSSYLQLKDRSKIKITLSARNLSAFSMMPPLLNFSTSKPALLMFLPNLNYSSALLYQSLLDMS